MKGLIFTTFSRLVEEKFGLETWDELIDRVDPESEGVYTSVDTYPDEELFAFVGELSKITGIAGEDLVRTFGEYAFGALVGLYPRFVEGKDLKGFLQSVQDVIHVEVRKLHPGAQLPTITYEDPAPDRLVMHYQSPRNIPALAEGLIRGASRHFGQEIDIECRPYRDNGDQVHRFDLRFGEKN